MAVRMPPRIGLCFAAFLSFLLAAARLIPAQTTVAIPLPQDQIHSAASGLLHHAGKADCKPGSCRILVTNLILPSGDTSPLGMQLADAFAAEIASQSSDFSVVERSRLRSFLEQERIPTKLLSETNAAKWLCSRMDATAVLTGAAEPRGDSALVSVTLSSCSKDKPGPLEEFKFPNANPAIFTPAEPYPHDPPVRESDPPLIRTARGNGPSAPSCQYCPNPSFTDPARIAKFSGDALLHIVVAADGSTSGISVMRGLPYGLNDQAVRTIQNWRFRPATHDGQPVDSSVAIEVTFRTR